MIKVGQSSKTWWGQHFLNALECFTDSSRLSRGRSYSSDNRIKKWSIEYGVVKADVRGNINTYFGVYKEPTYKITVQMTTLSQAQWQKVIEKLAERVSFISRLLLNEIPENIELAFEDANVQLLPKSYKDFIVKCSCPDYAVPCKHIAGVCFRLANQFDQNPFLLFEMRGLSPKELETELVKFPLGKLLANAKTAQDQPLEVVDSFYKRPVPIELPNQISLMQFWQGEKILPKNVESLHVASIPAVIIKKGGDYPAFWEKQSSFIFVMEDFYLRMRKFNLKTM